MGGPWGQPHSGGLWGVCPFTPTKVSLLDRGRPSPTLIKLGVEGAQPPPRGHGGCAPKNIKRGNESPTLATPPRVGAKTLANPEPTGVGKWGVQGGKAPMAGGVGGVPPKTKRGGESPTLATPPRVGPNTLANPKPTRAGKRGGPGGRSPHGGGLGGCPPTKP